MHMQSAYETFARSMHVYPNNAVNYFNVLLQICQYWTKYYGCVKSKRFVIGMQYQSDTVDMKGNRMKDWSDKNAKQFLRMCKQEQIGVINLVPITGKELIWDANADKVKIWDLLGIIAALDFVVCIDSVCGHIAGLVGTNNLRIWSSQSYYNQPAIYAYRPLRLNYTIYTGTNLADIPPKLVFYQVKGNLTRQNNFTKGTIRYARRRCKSICAKYGRILHKK